MKDERKTKKQLIEELDGLRDENADLRQKSAGTDMSGVERQLVVERVRAEAMDMRSTSDLHQVVAVLFSEMRRLGIETPGASIHFFDDEAGTQTAYGAWVDPRSLGFARDDNPAEDRFVVVDDILAGGGERCLSRTNNTSSIPGGRARSARTCSPQQTPPSVTGSLVPAA